MRHLPGFLETPAFEMVRGHPGWLCWWSCWQLQRHAPANLCTLKKKKNNKKVDTQMGCNIVWALNKTNLFHGHAVEGLYARWVNTPLSLRFVCSPAHVCLGWCLCYTKKWQHVGTNGVVAIQCSERLPLLQLRLGDVAMLASPRTCPIKRECVRKRDHMDDPTR